jgi:hypothetical protein
LAEARRDLRREVLSRLALDKAIAAIDDPAKYIEVSPHYRRGWIDALTAVRDDPATAGIDSLAPEGLDAAWAEAEAALPEGWRLSVAQHPDNYAAFATPPTLRRGGAPVGLGPTPAVALRALAARLTAPQHGPNCDADLRKDGCVCVPG